MDIDDVREEIKDKDLGIISLISERIGCAEEIARIKTSDGLPVRDPEVEKKVIERYVSEGREKGISEETMRTIARAIIEECVEAENAIIKELTKK